MLEALLEFVFEFLLQLLLEIFGELGLHKLVEYFANPPNRWLVAINYTLFGAGAGGVSLLLFPSHFVHDGFMRFANLVIHPLQRGFACVRLALGEVDVVSWFCEWTVFFTGIFSHWVWQSFATDLQIDSY